MVRRVRKLAVLGLLKSPIRNNWRKSSVAILVLVAACSVDHTDDPHLSGLVHQCFATVKDGIIYQTVCPPVSPGSFGFRGDSYCDTVTYVDQFPYAVTLNSFEADPQHWSEQISKTIKKASNAYGEFIVRGGLPAGTTFEITQMYRWNNGENGTFWLAIAAIRDGKFKGNRFTLPWAGSPPSYTFPWLRSAYPRRTIYPAIDARYMTPCADNSTTRQ